MVRLRRPQGPTPAFATTGISSLASDWPETADTRAAGRLWQAARSLRERGNDAASCGYWLARRLALAEITGAGLEWTVSMISVLSMPCR